MRSATRAIAGVAAAAPWVVAAVLCAGVVSHVAAEPAELLREMRGATGLERREVVAVAAGVATASEGYAATELVLGGRARHRAAAALLVVYTALLVARGLTQGWDVRCACLSAFVTQSVAAAVARNVLLLGLLALSARRRHIAAMARSIPGFAGTPAR